jgi:hypothetical protein
LKSSINQNLLIDPFLKGDIETQEMNSTSSSGNCGMFLHQKRAKFTIFPEEIKSHYKKRLRLCSPYFRNSAIKTLPSPCIFHVSRLPFPHDRIVPRHFRTTGAWASDKAGAESAATSFSAGGDNPALTIP